MPNCNRFWTVSPTGESLPHDGTWGLEYISCGVLPILSTVESAIPFHRFVRKDVNAHFWTHDLDEGNRLPGYEYEGEACRLFRQEKIPEGAAQYLIPLYRYQDLNGQPGMQFFWSVSNAENIANGAAPIDTGLRVFNWQKGSKTPICGDEYRHKSEIVPLYRFHNQVGDWCVTFWFKNGGNVAGNYSFTGTLKEVNDNLEFMKMALAQSLNVSPLLLETHGENGDIHPGKC